MSRWEWKVRGYYNDSVEPPKKPGELALEVVLMDDHSKDMEVRAFKSRKDIGHIDVSRI
jgi:hypothetical protein